MTVRPYGMAALAVMAAGLLVYGGADLFRVWQMQREVGDLEQEIGRLRVRQQELGADIRRMRDDPEAIEQAARELLGLVKPGERVLKLPPAPAPDPVLRPAN